MIIKKIFLLIFFIFLKLGGSISATNSKNTEYEDNVFNILKQFLGKKENLLIDIKKKDINFSIDKDNFLKKIANEPELIEQMIIFFFLDEKILNSLINQNIIDPQILGIINDKSNRKIINFLKNYQKKILVKEGEELIEKLNKKINQKKLKADFLNGIFIEYSQSDEDLLNNMDQLIQKRIYILADRLKQVELKIKEYDEKFNKALDHYNKKKYMESINKFTEKAKNKRDIVFLTEISQTKEKFEKEIAKDQTDINNIDAKKVQQLKEQLNDELNKREKIKFDLNKIKIKKEYLRKNYNKNLENKTLILNKKLQFLSDIADTRKAFFLKFSNINPNVKKEYFKLQFELKKLFKNVQENILKDENFSIIQSKDINNFYITTIDDLIKDFVIPQIDECQTNILKEKDVDLFVTEEIKTKKDITATEEREINSKYNEKILKKGNDISNNWYAKVDSLVDEHFNDNSSELKEELKSKIKNLLESSIKKNTSNNSNKKNNNIEKNNANIDTNSGKTRINHQINDFIKSNNNDSKKKEEYIITNSSEFYYKLKIFNLFINKKKIEEKIMELYNEFSNNMSSFSDEEMKDLEKTRADFEKKELEIIRQNKEKIEKKIQIFRQEIEKDLINLSQSLEENLKLIEENKLKYEKLMENNVGKETLKNEYIQLINKNKAQQTKLIENLEKKIKEHKEKNIEIEKIIGNENSTNLEKLIEDLQKQIQQHQKENQISQKTTTNLVKKDKRKTNRREKEKKRRKKNSLIINHKSQITEAQKKLEAIKTKLHNDLLITQYQSEILIMLKNSSIVEKNNFITKEIELVQKKKKLFEDYGLISKKNEKDMINEKLEDIKKELKELFTREYEDIDIQNDLITEEEKLIIIKLNEELKKNYSNAKNQLYISDLAEIIFNLQPTSNPAEVEEKIYKNLFNYENRINQFNTFKTSTINTLSTIDSEKMQEIIKRIQDNFDNNIQKDIENIKLLKENIKVINDINDNSTNEALYTIFFKLQTYYLNSYNANKLSKFKIKKDTLEKLSRILKSNKEKCSIKATIERSFQNIDKKISTIIENLDNLKNNKSNAIEKLKDFKFLADYYYKNEKDINNSSDPKNDKKKYLDEIIKILKNNLENIKQLFVKSNFKEQVLLIRNFGALLNPDRKNIKKNFFLNSAQDILDYKLDEKDDINTFHSDIFYLLQNYYENLDKDVYFVEKKNDKLLSLLLKNNIIEIKEKEQSFLSVESMGKNNFYKILKEYLKNDKKEKKQNKKDTKQNKKETKQNKISLYDEVLNLSKVLDKMKNVFQFSNDNFIIFVKDCIKNSIEYNKDLYKNEPLITIINNENLNELKTEDLLKKKELIKYLDDIHIECLENNIFENNFLHLIIYSLRETIKTKDKIQLGIEYINLLNNINISEFTKQDKNYIESKLLYIKRQIINYFDSPKFIMKKILEYNTQNHTTKKDYEEEFLKSKLYLSYINEKKFNDKKLDLESTLNNEKKMLDPELRIKYCLKNEMFMYHDSKDAYDDAYNYRETNLNNTNNIINDDPIKFPANNTKIEIQRPQKIQETQEKKETQEIKKQNKENEQLLSANKKKRYENYKFFEENNDDTLSITSTASNSSIDSNNSKKGYNNIDNLPGFPTENQKSDYLKDPTENNLDEKIKKEVNNQLNQLNKELDQEIKDKLISEIKEEFVTGKNLPEQSSKEKKERSLSEVLIKPKSLFIGGSVISTLIITKKKLSQNSNKTKHENKKEKSINLLKEDIEKSSNQNIQ